MKADRMRAQFNRLVHEPQIISMVACPDSLSAKIAERTGFKAIFQAGYTTSASELAMPDRGIADFGIMVNRAREIVNCVDIPVFADADTGYGNLMNVARTVRCYESIGVAGLFLEDQKWPKRCGHMDGKAVIPMEEMVEKIRTAARTRKHRDFLIMSRTDARAVYDLDEAIRRSRAYHQAGADMVFIEAPQNKEELKKISAAFPDVPLMANMIEHGKTPLMTADELQELGFRIMVHPTALAYAQTFAEQELLKELYTRKTTAGFMDRLVPFDQFNRFIGLDEVNQLEEKYTSAE
ncbi:isocitrate lyase/PEP mutase family protein [Sporolactobacillus vineae]|uniref:isocitrate lyase/PEP mutase family protein n=1 Tax=Sporolactobacillus vineae TaxID=444463 RepID=UPI000289DAEC|nr:oxaloacetate decarboxylase [Sporolactobacillus vineae]